MLPLHDDLISEAPKPSSRRAPPSVFRRPQPAQSAKIAALADLNRVIFLDVETTGLSWFYDTLTIVGWSYAGKYSTYFIGDDPEPLLQALREANALITFNGTLFDLRFLKKAFGNIALPPIHVDLRFLAKRAGLTGGQKEIERLLSLNVRSGFEDVDGAAAVVLWHRFIRGDNKSLKRLVEYNRSDILGMCRILDEVLDRLDVHPDLWFTRPRFSELAIDIAKQPVRLSKRVAKPRMLQDFRSLFTGTAAASATIVGIDLTGSEQRPSGWCLLKGNSAETARISTDDELLARIVEAKPILVSIDSPLSMPQGRTCVEDSDPFREQFGIMRECERELKRRGINVYPCLLPSMQGLTRRGMRLANRIRAAGIPVIESYPGAAQDIMGIPRKGAGEEFLKEGLSDFGITGEFCRSPVTHDELDAITSAIVGSFFLAGKFEALRGVTEDALIIPDPMTTGTKKLVVGISGRISAGKTTAAQFLQDRGFAYSRFSLAIDDEIRRRGATPDRTMRQVIGAELNKTYGQRWLADRTLERVTNSEVIVVDGLRFPEDRAFFVERFGSSFVHVHIMASDVIRAARYANGVPDERPFAVADSDVIESKVDTLETLADAVVRNEGSVADLSRDVLNCLRPFVTDQDFRCLSLSS